MSCNFMKTKRVMSNERCLVGYPFSRPKHFIEKNGFKRNKSCNKWGGTSSVERARTSVTALFSLACLQASALGKLEIPWEFSSRLPSLSIRDSAFLFFLQPTVAPCSGFPHGQQNVLFPANKPKRLHD